MQYTSADFSHSPFVAFYEVTRACDLICNHCRACAQPNPHKNELTTEQSLALLEQFSSFPKPPTLIFTGGDPMKRADIFELVRRSAALGMITAMTPSATPLVTKQALATLKEVGLSRLAVSLDGCDAKTHDDLRGVDGSFQRTWEILHDARAAGLSLQVNTTITSRNIHQVEAMATILSTVGMSLWSVFFLIPVGRGRSEQRIAPEQYEEVFHKLWRLSKVQPYAIKTTEAPHYRRFVLQRADDPQETPRFAPSDRVMRAPLGVADGKGCMFVSHTGSVYPSGFLPILAGKFPQSSIVDIYQNSEIFLALRDSEALRGKCHDCEFRDVCGGSRARAYAVSGDPLAAEPDCVYQPLKCRDRVACSV
jgi:radical SAM protein